MTHPYLKAIAIVFGVLFLTSVQAFAQGKTATSQGKQAVDSVDPVVATVNDSKIYLSEVEEARTRLPARFKGLPESAVFGLLVNSLVDTHLMATEARTLKLQEGKAFQRQIKRITNQLLERSLLAQRLEQELTEDAIKKRYDKYVEETAGRPEVHARHILVDNEGLAKEIIVRLKEGIDFVELAKKYSIGPSAPNGGDLGFFTKDQMAPEFSAAAFALVKGEFAPEPIKTQFGWHVIKVEDHRPSTAPSFEKAKGKIGALLSNEVASTFLKELRASAKINIILPPAPQQAGGAKTK